jgi:hypothetical protein
MIMIHQLSEILKHLDPKEWLTLAVSFSALAVSFLSFRQRATETTLGLRKQLTELLEKLTTLNKEEAVFRYLRDTPKGKEYPPGYVGLLNDQRRFFVRQAEFVSRRVKKFVSPYEYLVLAGAFAAIDDTVQAERFFEKAAKAPDLVDRSIAIRGYARYLFSRGQIADGRTRYQEALRILVGDSEHLKSRRADTYERWGTQEREWGSPEGADRLLALAVREYSGIANPERRRYEIDRVQRLIAATVPRTAVEQARDVEAGERPADEPEPLIRRDEEVNK